MIVIIIGMQQASQDAVVAAHSLKINIIADTCRQIVQIAIVIK